MVPLEPAFRRDFWMGFWIGVLFRYFAFGILAALVVGASTVHLSEVGGWLVWTPLALAGLASPLLVPFVAGFFTAYFWRQVLWPDKNKNQCSALWWSTGFSLPLHLFFVPFCLLLTVPVDYACCSGGLERGIAFWNGRLGRQFLGDFSTRDEEEPPS